VSTPSIPFSIPLSAMRRRSPCLSPRRLRGAGGQARRAVGAARPRRAAADARDHDGTAGGRGPVVVLVKRAMTAVAVLPVVR
jgi:hypothetical protein